ncbi:hypothetical protein [Photobacterium sp. 53610]|uniref:hypothetical protein n=1 Tax=Photobacterium sp. 53610 TaxID=3102789 RepID=UPI002ED8B67B
MKKRSVAEGGKLEGKSKHETDISKADQLDGFRRQIESDEVSTSIPGKKNCEAE